MITYTVVLVNDEGEVGRHEHIPLELALDLVRNALYRQPRMVSVTMVTE